MNRHSIWQIDNCWRRFCDGFDVLVHKVDLKNYEQKNFAVHNLAEDRISVCWDYQIKPYLANLIAADKTLSPSINFHHHLLAQAFVPKLYFCLNVVRRCFGKNISFHNEPPTKPKYPMRAIVPTSLNEKRIPICEISRLKSVASRCVYTNWQIDLRAPAQMSLPLLNFCGSIPV